MSVQRRKKTLYPRQFKLRVAEEVVTGLKGPAEASRDYDINVGVLKKWAKKYRDQILLKQSKEVLPLDSMKKQPPHTESDLEKKVRELEEETMRLRKQLNDSNLKVILLDKMIEIAERTYGIGVRKNSGAKQSKK